jgi:hypothetical protein
LRRLAVLKERLYSFVFEVLRREVLWRPMVL